MKKVFSSLLFFLCLSVFSLFAQQKYLGCINNGDYAYFIYNRYNTPYIKGYLVFHVEDDTSIIYSTTIDTITDQKGYVAFGTGLDENGKICITQLYGVSGETQEDQSFYIQNAVDFLNFAGMRMANLDNITEDCTLEDPWDDYTLWYHFSSVLPFLGFDTICFNNQENPLFTAYRYGHYKDYSAEIFDQFLNNDIQLVEPVDRNSGSVPPKTKAKKVNSNGYKITLDENWEEKTYENNISYWLNIQSYSEAQIMIEMSEGIVPTKTKEEKIAFARLMVQLIPGIIPTSVKAHFQKNDLILEYDVIDDQQWLTYTRIRITDKSIINFSSFKDVYEAKSCLHLILYRQLFLYPEKQSILLH